MLKNFILTINYITMNVIQRSTYRYRSFSYINLVLIDLHHPPITRDKLLNSSSPSNHSLSARRILPATQIINLNLNLDRLAHSATAISYRAYP